MPVRRADTRGINQDHVPQERGWMENIRMGNTEGILGIPILRNKPAQYPVQFTRVLDFVFLILLVLKVDYDHHPISILDEGRD